MLMYKALNMICLDDDVCGSQIGASLKNHSIMEDSIKLYRKLNKVKNCHRSILDNQVSDIRILEKEFPGREMEAQLDDSKSNLICYLVKQMVAL